VAGAVKWDLIADPTRYIRGFDKAENRGRQFQRHQTGLERSATRFSATLGSVGGVAVRAFGGATVAVGGLAAAGAVLGLKTAANLETAEVAFTRLLGSAKRARTFLGDLKSFAARTPFELPGLVDASRALVGAGTAAKDVIPTLTALGDASGALGLDQERFGRVMLAVTQIMNRGKVQAEELNQITEAGIPVWQLLADATGKPVPELQKLMESGKLLSKDVLPALFDQMRKDYGGGMEQQSRTLAGVWSTFKDTISLTLSDALQPLIPVLKTALPEAARIFQDAVQGIVDFFRDDFIPELKDAKTWLDDNETSIKAVADAYTLLLIPAGDNTTTMFDGLKGGGSLLARELRGVALTAAELAEFFLTLGLAAGETLKFFVNLGIGGLKLVNVIDKLSGGSGHAADSMIEDFRAFRDSVDTQTQKVREQLKKTQDAIDKLHGKNIDISAALKLNFSPSFTQKDWVNVRLAAGRIATGGPIKGPGPRGVDSQLYWLAPGEHVWNDREVTAAGGHAAMERWRQAVLAGRVQELATGGPVGRIDTQTRNINKIQAWGTGRRMDAGLTKLLSLAPSSIPHTAGSWRLAVDYLRRLGMAFSVISTYRPGARTRASGSVSYHALNRAVDIAGPNMLAIFEALTRTNPTELIYSGADRYKSRRGWSPIGQLDPITLADHWSHVHAAYDRGGVLMPGEAGVNLARKPEIVLPPGERFPTATEIARALAAELRANPPVLALRDLQAASNAYAGRLGQRRPYR
jgi:tape measure domain-containing protein